MSDPKTDEDDGFLPPQRRADLAGHGDVEQRLRQMLTEGALSHGWIIAGSKGAGKATLAYRVARGLLDPSALKTPDSFDIDEEARVFRLVAGEAHPDLFVAQRAWDEKKSRYQTEISVEIIRNLTQFLNKTASDGGYRIAIIDIADDMNRNAANALLKALEEPPEKTLLLLLAEAPGRLIATIRSRCRRIDLRPASDEEVIAFVKREAGLGDKDASLIAAHAGGRPGHALLLAESDGAEAITLANAFLAGARKGEDISRVASALTSKAGEARWAIFKEIITRAISDAARNAAAGEAVAKPLNGASVQGLIEAHAVLDGLLGRGEALNLDRGQLIRAVAYDLHAALAADAA